MATLQEQLQRLQQASAPESKSPQPNVGGAEAASELPTLQRLARLLQREGHLEEETGAEDTGPTLQRSTTFAELGIDSLDKIELAIRCEQEFGVRLDLADPPATEWRTAADIIDFIDNQGANQ